MEVVAANTHCSVAHAGLAAVTTIPQPTRVVLDAVPNESPIGFWVPLAIQLVLAAAAVWLAVETRLLRQRDEIRARQAEEQLQLMREQGRLTLLVPLELAPLTHAGYEHYLEDKFANVGITSEYDSWKSRGYKNQKPANFVLLVGNNSERLAQNLVALYYDALAKRFIWADDGAEQLAKNVRPFMFFEPDVSLDQIKADLLFQYGRSSEYFFQFVPPADEASFVAVFYVDLEGRLYMRRRRFFVHGTDVRKVAIETFTDA